MNLSNDETRNDAAKRGKDQSDRMRSGMFRERLVLPVLKAVF
jgi:hypothetical protein